MANNSLTFDVAYVIILSMMNKSRYFNEDRVDLRFKAPKLRRSYHLSKLWDIHHEIVRRISLGEMNKDIAADLGVSESMVSYTKNSKVCRDKVSIMQSSFDAGTIDLGQRIQKFAPIALKVLEDIVEGVGPGEDASPALRARYADRHMDRAGYSPVKKTASITTTLTPQEIEEIKGRSKEAALKSGVAVIEAEVREVN